MSNEYILLQQQDISTFSLVSFQKPARSTKAQSFLTVIRISFLNGQVKKQIVALEDSNVAEKSWQLIGETSATARPTNSLLEEILQFDHTTVAGMYISNSKYS